MDEASGRELPPRAPGGLTIDRQNSPGFRDLKSGFPASDALAAELSTHVKRRLSAHAYPREVEFVESLPKTPSGKIQRLIQRNQEIAKASPGSR